MPPLKYLGVSIVSILKDYKSMKVYGTATPCPITKIFLAKNFQIPWMFGSGILLFL